MTRRKGEKGKRRKGEKSGIHRGRLPLLTAHCSLLTEPMIAHVSKWVLPVDQPPIRDGAVVVAGDRIAAVGPAAEVLTGFTGLICDHGAGAILPGVVNCHVHLEFSALAGQGAAPGALGGLAGGDPGRVRGAVAGRGGGRASPAASRPCGGAARSWWGRSPTPGLRGPTWKPARWRTTCSMSAWGSTWWRPSTCRSTFPFSAGLRWRPRPASPPRPMRPIPCPPPCSGPWPSGTPPGRGPRWCTWPNPRRKWTFWREAMAFLRTC